MGAVVKEHIVALEAAARADWGDWVIEHLPQGTLEKLRRQGSILSEVSAEGSGQVGSPITARPSPEAEDEGNTAKLKFLTICLKQCQYRDGISFSKLQKGRGHGTRHR